MEISSSSGIVFRRPIPCGSVENQFHSSSKAKLLLIGVSSSIPTPTPTPTLTRRRVFNKLTLSLQPSPSRIITKLSTSAAFSDTGHLNYYHAPAVRCGKHDDKNKNKNKNNNKITTTTTTKKKLKLLKALSKDLSMFSDSGFSVDPYTAFFGQLQGNIVSEAADALLRQLQQVRAEEKELKRKKKLDKAQLKATRMTTMLHSDSSSSSGSSDSECGEVIQMSRLIRKEKEKEKEKDKEAFVQPIIVHELEAGTPEESTSTLPSSLTCCSRSISTTENHAAVQCCSESSSSNVVCDGGNGLVTGLSSKRIEVCMGGKCKKSGGAELLEEFERAIGSSNVVGCKCMGKCKDGPNVRVLNCFDVVEAQGLHDDSVRTPTNPLCIGVGLADVGVILANFFGEDGSFAPAV